MRDCTILSLKGVSLDLSTNPDLPEGFLIIAKLVLLLLFGLVGKKKMVRAKSMNSKCQAGHTA